MIFDDADLRCADEWPIQEFQYVDGEMLAAIAAVTKIPLRNTLHYIKEICVLLSRITRVLPFVDVGKHHAILDHPAHEPSIIKQIRDGTCSRRFSVYMRVSRFLPVAHFDYHIFAPAKSQRYTLFLFSDTSTVATYKRCSFTGFGA